MSATTIEWSDMVWNPVTGCSKVSAGCKFCYAERVWPRVYGDRAFTDVRTYPDRLEQPLHWSKPRRIFVNSMSDLFHEAIPFAFIEEVFKVIRDWHCSQHIFQILTKRPQRVLDYWEWRKNTRFAGNKQCVWPDNAHLGVSCEDQPTADERITLLRQTPAAVRFISYEPALGPLQLLPKGASIENQRFPNDFERWSEKRKAEWYEGTARATYISRQIGIDWVIAGGESGPNARPSDLQWFRDVKDQCQAAGIPLFMKQITDHGRKIPFDQWPEDLRVREFPNATR